MHYSQSHFFFGLDNVMDDKLRREWSIYIEPAEHYLLEYFALVPTTKSRAIIFSDYWFIANLKPLLYLDDYPAYHFCFWLVIFLNNNVAFFYVLLQERCEHVRYCRYFIICGRLYPFFKKCPYIVLIDNICNFFFRSTKKRIRLHSGMLN